MMIKKRNILSLMVLPAMWLATGCADNMSLEDNTTAGNGEENVVTFTVKTQPQTLQTRGDEDDITRHISDGLGVDVLVFAVYESDDNTTYTLAESFAKEGTEQKGYVKRGKGQNILTNVSDMFYGGLQLQLIIDPQKYYKVAFWSQNSSFDKFDATDLTNVKVNYAGTSIEDEDDPGFGQTNNDGQTNNNEKSDAFCAVKQLVPGATGRQEVILRRPFAQINVATSGWDYEGVGILDPNKAKYMWSEIVVKGVAQAYNVVKEESVTTEKVANDLLTNVYLTYDLMPAFYQYLLADRKDDIAKAPCTYVFKGEDGIYPEDELLKVKRKDFLGHEYDFNLMSDDKFYDYLTWHRYFNFKGALSDKETDQGYNPNDQFNKKYYSITTDDEGVEHIEEVDSEAEGFNPDDYFTTSQLFEYIDSNNNATSKKIFTEIYKYLSMCYVLVPTGVDSNGAATGSAVSIEMRFKGKTLDANGEATGTDVETGWFTIDNVPVQKNWRTNIIGDGFFMVNQKFNFYVIPDYCGEYDYLNDDDKSDKDSWLWDMDWTGGDDDTDWGLNKGGFIYDDCHTTQEWYQYWKDKEDKSNNKKD